MLRSMQSPNVGHEEHLRQLLDQRAARADLHNRFPSNNSYSECSDSPSMYSHGAFSPHSRYHTESDDHAHYSPSTIAPAPRSPLYDRERLNDPSESMLDLDSDSFVSRDDGYDDGSSAQSINVEDEEEPVPRMSYLGPKMKKNAPAPWEMGEDVLDEEAEPPAEELQRTFSGPKSEQTMASKAGGFMRNIGLASRSSSSGSRPSVDSTHSSAKPKQSFESTSSYMTPGGALHALAQASMSSTSLVSGSSQAKSRPKLALLRPRPRTASNSKKPPAASLQQPSPQPVLSSARSSPSSPTSPSDYPVPSSRDFPRPPSPAHSDMASHDQHSEYIHPYANPESARYARNDTFVPPPPVSHRPDARRVFTDNTVTSSESEWTITDGSTAASRSMGSMITPDTSASFMLHRPHGSHSSSGSGGFQGKEISQPTVISSPSRFNVGVDAQLDDVRQAGKGIVGWNDAPLSPAFTLISLEEAQAQVRDRQRSVTAHAALSPVPAMNGPQTAVPFPDNGLNHSKSSSSMRSISSTTHRSRARSIGAVSAKKLQGMGVEFNRNAPQRSNTEDSTHSADGPSQKTIGRKKSGFLRMFGSKDRERTQTVPLPIPPVPSMPDDFAAQLPTPRPTKEMKRVPVPSLSPSLLAESDVSHQTHSHSAESNSHSSHDTVAAREHVSIIHRRNSLSLRRAAPILSIIPPQSRDARSDYDSGSRSRHHTNNGTPTTSKTDPTAQAPSPGLLSPSPRSNAPQSAPPTRTDFQLSLRPVSTAFSAHFTEHLVDEPEEQRGSDYEFDKLDTPLSATTATNPTPSTPFSSAAFQLPLVSTEFGEPRYQKPAPGPVEGDDQSAIIQALQEQVRTSAINSHRRIWELEGKVRDLTAEVEQLRFNGGRPGYCELCGRGPSPGEDEGNRGSVVNRPRARTGCGGRFACGE